MISPFVLIRLPIELGHAVFFAALYVIAGAVESTGALESLASNILDGSGGNTFLIAVALLLVGLFLTAFLSAGPSTVILIPLALSLGTAIPGNVEWWALSLGVLAGSSCTPIGATAGPVMMSIYERETGKRFSILSFLRIGVPSAAVFSILSLVYLYVLLGF